MSFFVGVSRCFLELFERAAAARSRSSARASMALIAARECDGSSCCLCKAECKAFNFDRKFGEVSALKQPTVPNSGASDLFLATHAAACAVKCPWAS